jgi:putative endonuclease
MRPSTLQRGDLAESTATRLLRAGRLEIVETKFRCDAGELDIVARHGSLLVFVEVRSRADAEHGDAIAMVDRRKQRQVVRVAQCYLFLREPAYEEIRFDVVGITAGVADWIEDAFRPGRY